MYLSQYCRPPTYSPSPLIATSVPMNLCSFLSACGDRFQEFIVQQPGQLVEHTVDDARRRRRGVTPRWNISRHEQYRCEDRIDRRNHTRFLLARWCIDLILSDGPSDQPGSAERAALGRGGGSTCDGNRPGLKCASYLRDIILQDQAQVPSRTSFLKASVAQVVGRGAVPLGKTTTSVPEGLRRLALKSVGRS